MTTVYPTPYVEIGRTYAALRRGGATQARARAELELSDERGRVLEARLRAHVRPRFDRCAAHVAAVLAAGGYPALGR
ncbi:hypothetical protein [uncultured Phenylobacterium sp.]|uniref:hypothetical protein n=1 Tax=uncultured Phenylobacterium sp. TaxID=349273 RepID=UPI0025F52DEA|nr:hypothetical protein [uncultured Phenylobacterium sp.]